MVSVLRAGVDEAEEERGEDDPEELVPVEEGKSEERGRVAGVEAGEEQSEVGEKEERQPSRSTSAGGRLGSVGRRGHGHRIKERTRGPGEMNRVE